MRLPISPTNIDRPRRRAEPRSAFALIELLVVMAIIAILMGLTFAALSAFRTQGERQETVSTLQNLQNAYSQYRSNIPRGAGSRHIYHTDVDPDDAMAHFLDRAWQVEQARDVLNTLGERLYFDHPDDPPLAVFDAWDSEIVFRHWRDGEYEQAPDPVHPNRPRPYFASPGPSGDFEYEDDNVYSFEIGD